MAMFIKNTSHHIRPRESKHLITISGGPIRNRQPYFKTFN